MATWRSTLRRVRWSTKTPDTIILCHGTLSSLPSRHSQGHLVVYRRLAQPDPVVVLALFFRHQLQRTVFAVLAKNVPNTFGEMEVLAEEDFRELVEAVIVCHPLEHENSLFECLAQRNATNGSGIGASQCLYFFGLQFPLLVIEGLSCARIGSCGDVVVVLELPVRPTSEVL